MMIMLFQFTGCCRGDVRLVGGNSDFEGRVEVCLEGVQISVMTVCDDFWDNTDARVVCRQLTGLPFEGIGIIMYSLMTFANHLLIFHCSCTISQFCFLW